MIRTRSKVSMVLTSSPARVENLTAPPLSKLLRRRNSSSSSSSAVRSSPMLIVRGVNLQEEREPSSPKVSCTGQVFISKRSSQGSKKDIFCNPFLKIQFKKFKLFLKQPSCCQRSEVESQRLLKVEDGPLMAGQRAQLAVSEEEEKVESFTSAIPPKNALSLMRCRSAPQRSAAVVPDRVGGAAESSTAAAVAGSSPSLNSRPLILTRCRSEPAWMAAKMTALEAHNCFWNAARANRMAAAGSG